MNSVVGIKNESQDENFTIEDFKLKAAGLMVKAVKNSDVLIHWNGSVLF